MLVHYLNLAIETLQSLIDITKTDIEDIKQAHHEILFNRVKGKDELVSVFEKYKCMIDNELLSLSQKNIGVELKDLLNAEQKELLQDMKVQLEQLKNLNRRYAKIVLTVSSFYNSLMERMLPADDNKIGYDGLPQRRSSLFETKA